MASTTASIDAPVEPVAAEREPASVPLGLRAYLTSSGALPLILGLAIVGVLLPAVVVPYAYADDYSYLWMAVSGEANPQFGESVFQANAVNGRPLTGVLVQIGFGAAGEIEALRLVRAVGVLGIVALGLLVHWALIRSSVRAGVAALIALFMCSMPPFQVYGSWTVLFVAPWAAVLGGVASMLAARAADEGALAPRRVGLAAAALIGGLWMYQPAAMLFWVFLAIGLVGAIEEPRRAVRLAWVHGLVAAAALAVAYAQTRLTMAYYGDAVLESARARAELSIDVVGRARWFVEQPLYQASGLFDLSPTAWGAATVGLVAAGGLLAGIFARARRPWVFIGLAAALVPLSYLPNLVVQEEQHPYRTQAALTALIALYVALGAVALWSLGAGWMGGRLNLGSLRGVRAAAWGGAIGVVALSCAFAGWNVANLMAGPQMLELRMWRAQVRALPPTAPRVSFVQTGWYLGMSDRVYNDELGLASSARPFAIRPATQLILREEGRLTAGYAGPVIEYFPLDVRELPANQPRIDLRGIVWLR